MTQPGEVSGGDAILAEDPGRSRVSKELERKDNVAAYPGAGATKLAAVSNLATSGLAEAGNGIAAKTVANGTEKRRHGSEWKLEGSLSSLHSKVDALSMRLSNVESVVEVLVQQKREIDDNFNRVQEVLKEIEIRVRGPSANGAQNNFLLHGRDREGGGGCL